MADDKSSEVQVSEESGLSPLLKNDDIYLSNLGRYKRELLNRLPKELFSNKKNFDVELFVRYVGERWIKDDDDCYVAVTGFKGKGKSTLSLRMAMYYSKIFLNKNINLRKNILYSSDIKKIFWRLKTASDGDVIVFDEASRFILGEDWNVEHHKLLKKIFAEIRTKHLFIIFTCPFQFSNIDSKYRNSLFKYWINCFDKGVGLIFQRNMSPVGDAFYLDWFKKRMKFLGENSFLDDKIFGMLMSHPCFYHSITWTALPKHIYLRYLKVRDSFVYEREIEDELERKANEQTSKVESKLVKTVANLKANGMNKIEIANTTGLSVYSVTKYLMTSEAKRIIEEAEKNMIKEIENGERVEMEIEEKHKTLRGE